MSLKIAVFSILLFSLPYTLGLKCLVCEGTIKEGASNDTLCVEGNKAFEKPCNTLQDVDSSARAMYPGVDLKNLVVTCGKLLKSYPNNVQKLRRTCSMVQRYNKGDANICQENTFYLANDNEREVPGVQVQLPNAKLLQVEQFMCNCNEEDSCNSATTIGGTKLLFILACGFFAYISFF